MTAEEQAVGIVNKLYKFFDTFIAEHGIEKAGEKQKLVKTELDQALASLKKLEPTCKKTIYYLQYGRALNILPEYSKECEDCLSKAVKRDPLLIEGWNLLGETFWKKADIPAAKDCFEGSLKREKNKVALRSMSMVLRQLKVSANGQQEYVNNIFKSVEYAKNSVDLGPNDGMSWYILGNAYLSLFFATDHSAQTLSMALNAYSQAEKVDANAKYNPDLHFNRAQANRYEESYKKAFEGWQHALDLDPGWSDPQVRKQELLVYLTKVNTLVQQKGKVKAKRLAGMINSIDERALGPLSEEKLAEKNIKLQSVKLTGLEEGKNPEKVIIGRVVCNFADVVKVPFTLAMVDAAGECCAVTIYNLAEGRGMIIGDSIAIPEPYLTKVDITLPNEEQTQCKFTSLRVGNPSILVVNGKRLPSDNCAFVKASMDARN